MSIPWPRTVEISRVDPAHQTPAMPKRNFDLLDVVASVRDVSRSCVGYRVANVYDIDMKTYLFKLQKKDMPKLTLLMESGVRFHLTNFVRDKADSPSHFSQKLRKHIRTRVLTSVKQLGNDRVVDFTFGYDEASSHLILEMYAKGNLILTDDKYTILALLRSHTYDEDTKVAIGQEYPVSNVNVVRNAEDVGDVDIDPGIFDCFESWLLRSRDKALKIGEYAQVAEEPEEAEAATVTKKLGGKQGAQVVRKTTRRGGGKSKKNSISLKNLLMYAGCPVESGYFGPAIVEHCLLRAEVNGTMSLTEAWEGLPRAETIRLVKTFLSIPSFLESLMSAEGSACKGYISYESIKPAAKNSDSSKTTQLSDEGHLEVFTDFFPLILAQNEGATNLKEFSSFNEAVDEFFSKSEAQKAAKRHNMAEKTANSKLQKMSAQQEQRIRKLQEEQSTSIAKAQAIEMNADDIEKVRLVINSALANGLDWGELKELVKMEQARHNPIAMLVAHLKLDQNAVALKLPTFDDEGNEYAVVVDINVSLSAYKNATKYFSAKKSIAKKTEKTKEASVQLLSQAAATVKKELEKAERKLQTTIIKQARKVYWFERFDWFISSENYLVVYGRDAQQNEQLVKRYMRKGDVYVHADVHGASSCIVRNNDMKRIVPQQTLDEAGHMCMCRSSAWKGRTISSAWWVYHDQVSKTAPSGEYLSTGSFMIRGKKNFLHPSRLECGFGLLFRVREECIASHANERTVKGGDLPEMADFVEDSKSGPTMRKYERKLLRREAEEEAEMVEAANLAFNRQAVQVEAAFDNDKIVELPAPFAPQCSPGAIGLPTTYKGHEESTVDVESTGETKPEGSGALSSLDDAKEHNPVSQRKKISRYERKVMRGKRGGESTMASKKTDGTLESNLVPAKQHNLPRGKRGKFKKMKTKYKNQDEDERRMRMAMLGNPLPEPREIYHQSGSEAEHSEGNVPNVSKKGGKFGTSSNNEKKKGNRDNRNGKLDLQEPADVPDEVLSALTAEPKPHDELMFCLPVCAPYETMAKYKYKIKLTPGTQKRGAAASTAHKFFLQKRSDTTKLETDLIRAISESELIANMLSNVRIATAGIGKLQVQTKQKKKLAKQEKDGKKGKR